jgi:hypothetical protein
VQENPFFEHELDRLGEHDLFYIPPRVHHRRGAVSVIHRDNVLRDDRAGVEIVGDDVRRGADDFYAALVGLMVRFGADERRQKRVVDIDHSLGAVIAYRARCSAQDMTIGNSAQKAIARFGKRSCAASRSDFRIFVAKSRMPLRHISLKLLLAAQQRTSQGANHGCTDEDKKRTHFSQYA